jgi:hypothetical protein
MPVDGGYPIQDNGQYVGGLGISGGTYDHEPAPRLCYRHRHRHRYDRKSGTWTSAAVGSEDGSVTWLDGLPDS